MLFRTAPVSDETYSVGLAAIPFVLIVLWLLCVITSATIGGLVHVLLAAAIVIVLLRVIQGPRAFGGRKGTERPSA